MLHVRKLDYFYSRPCGRGDVRGNLKIALVNISTHAPAGGATARASRLAVGAIFLLTPLREGRRGRMKRLRLFLLFLLTPLREGRRHTVASLSIIINFYSRPCGRGDKPIRYVFGDERISTHAPAGGATRRNGRSANQNSNFYSRPCGRGDLPVLRLSGLSFWHFYSRPCGRGDG